MNKKDFINYLNNLNLDVTEDKLEKLDEYFKLLVNWNKKMNLTSIIEEKDVYLKHYYDSLTICNYINLKSVKSVIDIGSGAGFPGIVIKIFFENIYLDIVDSNNKKIKFLSELIKKLNLKNVNLIHDRAENYAKNNLDKYDICISRAVAPLNILTELCLPYVKINGYFIALKGDLKNELEESKKKIRLLGGKIVSEDKFLLPIENSARCILKIKKITSTPVGYPRSYDKIKKDRIK